MGGWVGGREGAGVDVCGGVGGGGGQGGRGGGGGAWTGGVTKAVLVGKAGSSRTIYPLGRHSGSRTIQAVPGRRSTGRSTRYRPPSPTTCMP